MKVVFGLTALLAVCHMAASYNVTCFYDTASIQRGGSANFTIPDLETALQLCTHVVYGYVGMKPGSYEISHLHNKQHQQFELVRSLKQKFRSVKFLLSIGGDRDREQPEKYMQLLEGGTAAQSKFIRSAQEVLKKYKFDGLDLAYQLPRNKVLKKRSKVSATAKKLKNFVKPGKKVNAKALARKQQLTQLIGDLKQALSSNKMMLSLTVMPNVNSSLYFDVPAVMKHVDIVNLAAFDYSTPYSSPKVADYLAPLNAPSKHAVRSPKANVDSEVQYWLTQHADHKKLNLGVASFGRTWKITDILKSDRLPIVAGLKGPADGATQTHTAGFMSWYEICQLVTKMTKVEDKKMGNFAYRPKDLKDSQGLLVTYDDPTSIKEKAMYVVNRSLGGMALFDISTDDFRGQCDGKKFPILQGMRSRLL